MKKVFFLFLLLSGVATHKILAQVPYNTPFGQVKVEDLDAGHYEALGDSPVVLLLNYRAVGFSQTSTRPVLELFSLKRYKIVGAEGLKLAEQEVYINTEEETLVEIRAATYQVNPRGEVIAYKVRKNRIDKEKVGKNRFKYSFTLPVVREGAVIEVEVQTRTKNYQRIPDWDFRGKYPTVRAEHHAFIPNGFEYTRLLKGDMPDIASAVIPYAESRPNIGSQPFTDLRSTRMPSRRSPMSMYGDHEVFVMENLPPAVREAFTPVKTSYLPRIGYQLKRDLFWGNSGLRVFNGWEDLHRYVKKKYSPKKLKAEPEEWQNALSRSLKSRAKSDPRAFAEGLVRYVQKRVRWDSTLSHEVKKLRDVWDKGQGNGAEINLIAYELFQKNGFEAYPVFISTVDHGEVQPSLAYIDQFNHIILSVKVGDEMLLLDLVNEQESLDLLPERDLNQRGLMIGREGHRWIPLRHQNPSIRYTYSRFTLDESGKLVGQIEELHKKQSLADVEKQLEEVGKDPLAYWKNVQFSGLNATSFRSGTQAKSGVPETLKLVCEVSTSDFSEVSSDVMIVQPMLIRQLKENPFTQENRTTPVDLTHPIREAHLLGLEIPAGYEVVQTPRPTRVILPNGGGTFVYNITQMGNIIHVSSSIFLDQTLFLPQEYPNLKEFFKLVVSKHEEDIILARKK